MIQLMCNGCSNSERTFDIFFLNDRITTGDVDIQYLPTTDMIADILTKPLRKELFKKLRKELLDITPLNLMYTEGCKTEDRTGPPLASVRTRTNPRFPYPTPKIN